MNKKKLLQSVLNTPVFLAMNGKTRTASQITKNTHVPHY